MINAACNTAMNVKPEKIKTFDDRLNYALEAFRQIYNGTQEREEKHLPEQWTLEPPTKIRRRIRNALYDMEVEVTHG